MEVSLYKIKYSPTRKCWYYTQSNRPTIRVRKVVIGNKTEYRAELLGYLKYGYTRSISQERAFKLASNIWWW